MASFPFFKSIIGVVLFALLLMQLWLIFRNQTLSIPRKGVRVALNLLLWAVLSLYLLQPHWGFTADTSRVLLADDNVPSAFVQKIKDSLSIKESFSLEDFNRHRFEDPNFTNQLGAVTLVGENFSSNLLSQLSRQNLQWIPYFKADELQDIQWKALLLRGEMQMVTGEINSSKQQILKIKYANQLLDSLLLQEGFNTFSLQFPAFALGKTETQLVLDDKPLQSIHFFTRKTSPLSYLFILENPDFESKTLADWLGKNGHTVQLITTIAKNLQNSTSINQTPNQKTKPDVIVTDPSNASHPQVKKAAAAGKSILFMNLDNPTQDIKNINLGLGTHWQIKKISNEESIPLPNELTAIPYQFINTNNQKNVLGYPVAIQKTVGKVGISLINETFPLKLSGDSLSYQQLWTAILSQLQPSLPNNIEIDAPIVSGVSTSIHFNNLAAKPTSTHIEKDTIALTYSPINPLSASATYQFRREGWQPFQDSLELFVYEELTAATQSTLLKHYLLAHSTQQSGNTQATNLSSQLSFPAWVWFLLLLTCLTMLWVEPKVG